VKVIWDKSVGTSMMVLHIKATKTVVSLQPSEWPKAPERKKRREEAQSMDTRSHASRLAAISKKCCSSDGLSRIAERGRNQAQMNPLHNNLFYSRHNVN
jgi:hypothetical protein